MVRAQKKTVRKEQVPVYFTKEEKIKIERLANKALLATSPFLRKFIVEGLQIQTEA